MWFSSSHACSWVPLNYLNAFGDCRLKSKYNTKKPYRTCTCRIWYTFHRCTFLLEIFLHLAIIFAYLCFIWVMCKLFYMFVLFVLRLNSLCRIWTRYRFWHSKMHIGCCCFCHICTQMDCIRVVNPIFDRHYNFSHDGDDTAVWNLRLDQIK